MRSMGSPPRRKEQLVKRRKEDWKSSGGEVPALRSTRVIEWHAQKWGSHISLSLGCRRGTTQHKEGPHPLHFPAVTVGLGFFRTQHQSLQESLLDTLPKEILVSLYSHTTLKAAKLTQTRGPFLPCILSVARLNRDTQEDVRTLQDQQLA